jgi:hypothetical protein
MNKLRRIIASFLPTLLVLAFLTGNAGAALQAVGPVDPVTTLPTFYQDTGNLALQPCLDQNGFCLLTPLFDPAITNPPAPITTTGPVNDTNLPAEAFYYSANALLNIEASNELARLDFVLEYAFLTGVVPNTGIVFLRTDLQKMRNLTPNSTYRVTHPYGTFTFTTDGAGNTTGGGGVAVRQEDPSGTAANYMPPLMQSAAITNIGPFLKPASGILPTAVVNGATHTYIGDAVTPVAVTGSPTGNNFYRIERLTAAGTVAATWQTNLFTLAGRVYTGQIPSPMTVDRVTYARDAAGAVQIDAFATALPTAFLSISGTGLAASSLDQDFPNTGKFFTHLTAGALPTGVTMVNSLDVPHIDYPIAMIDEVIISQAQYDPVARSLTIKAYSRDKLAPLPVLSVTAFGAVQNLDATGTAVIPLPANTIPPMTVQVKSSLGGSATAFVSVVTPPPAPLAINDAATTVAATPVTIDVLVNDTTTAALDPSTVTIVAPSANGTTVVNGTGSITFTPAAGFAGTTTFTYNVKDTFGQVSNAATVTVTVTVAPLLVTTTSPLAPYTLGSGVYTPPVLAATGGIAPYTWAVEAGSTLPPGLALSAGALSGTPTTAGTYNFSLQITDSQATPAIATKAFTLVVSPAPLVITTASPLTPYTLGSGAYTAPVLAATGGIAPYTWAVEAGSTLPPGLALSAGALSGTPTTAGSYNFSLQVTDSQATPVTATKAFALVVSPGAVIPPLVINTTSPFPSYTLGSGAYLNPLLIATGGTAPYTWAVEAGSTLPPGLALSAGALSGTPTTAGTFTFSLQVTDSQATPATTAKAFTLVVSPAGTVNITTASPFPSYTLGSGAYIAPALAATGGITPYTWAVAAGSTLPPGLTLNAGAISGTPTTAGTYNFSLQVTDSQVTPATTTKAFTLVVSPAPLVITTVSPLPPYTLGNGAYIAPALAATGGIAPYTWAVAAGSTLPPGLTLNAGALSGTPTTAGTYNFSLQVTDSQVTPATATKAFTLVVSPAITTPTGTIVINGDALATRSTSVTLTLSATSPNGAVNQMQFSKDAGATWFALETFVTTRIATIQGTQGVNTLWVRFRDVTGVLSPIYSDTIIYDTVPPTGTIAVASPNPTTLTTGTLALTATDNVGGSGVTQMQFSTNNGTTFFPPEPFATTRSVSLPNIGVNSFMVRFLDAAGNISGSKSVSITRN